MTQKEQEAKLFLMCMEAIAHDEYVREIHAFSTKKVIEARGGSSPQEKVQEVHESVMALKSFVEHCVLELPDKSPAVKKIDEEGGLLFLSDVVYSLAISLAIVKREEALA